MNETTPSAPITSMAMFEDRPHGLDQLPVDHEQWLTFPPLRLVVAIACRRRLRYDDPDKVLDVVVDGVRCVLTVSHTSDAERLSPREREIVALVARGYTNKMIATLLHISMWTVSTHLRRIFAKLGVSTRAAMVASVDNETSSRGGPQPMSTPAIARSRAMTSTATSS